MTAVSHNKTCSLCFAFKVNAYDTKEGQCHYHPPKVINAEQDSLVSTWPIVDADDWCTKWQLRIQRSNIQVTVDALDDEEDD